MILAHLHLIEVDEGLLKAKELDEYRELEIK
jgi:hypothetical protein